jgi:phosphoribosylanthranilate isomerase
LRSYRHTCPLYVCSQYDFDMEMFKDYIQIAGVIDEPEARMLIECGVKFIGFPLKLSSHEEDLSENMTANIIRNFPTAVCGVLITYLREASDISGLCRFLGTNIVQVHGEIDESELSKLRRMARNLLIIKSLIVRDDNLAELQGKMKLFSPYVDAFLTDTHDPLTGAHGATGKTHNWDVSRKLFEMSPKPLILAGGLNPQNVQSAILRVRPSGVDVHTGVELNDGRKSPELVRAFMSEAKKAFELMGLK